MNKKALKGNARITMGRNITRLFWTFALIVLSFQFGMETYGFLSLSICFIWVVYELLGPTIYTAISKLVQTRIRKGQIKNAQQIKRSGIVFCVLLSGIVCGTLFGMSQILCLYILKEPMFYLPFLVCLPGLFFILFSSCLEGFCAGNGIISYLTKLIHLILFLVLCFVLSNVIAKSGNNIAMLLRSDSYESLYQAITVSLSFSAASFVTFIINIIVYHMISSEIHVKAKRDDSRVRESSATAAGIFTSSFLTYLPRNSVFALLFGLPFLVIYIRNQKFPEWIPSLNQFGILVAIILGGGLFLFSLFQCFEVRALFECASLYRREEYVRLNDSVMDARHNLSLTALPTAIIISVLAKHFCIMIGGVDGEFWVPVVMLSGIGIYIGSIAIFQLDLCREIGFLVESNMILVGSYIISVLVFFMLLKPGTGEAPLNMAISWLVFFFLLALGTGFFLNRKLELTEELIRTFFYPLIISALTGLVLLGFSKVFSSIISDMLLFFIGLALGYIIQSLLSVLLHNVSRRECRKYNGILLINFIGRISGYL